jgi:hypothetical protein
VEQGLCQEFTLTAQGCALILLEKMTFVPVVPDFARQGEELRQNRGSEDRQRGS